MGIDVAEYLYNLAVSERLKFMDYKSTYFAFLQEDCIREFGQYDGTKIYNQACECLTSMLKNADYRNNKGIKEHIVKSMFPIIAYYLTLKERGYSKEDAYDLTLKVSQKMAFILKAKNETLAKLPFAYKIFKFFSKIVMKKEYPVEGWITEWVKFNNDEIHINFKSCLYVELTTQYGCPELCTVFCKNDTVTFSGFEPKIHFIRNGTIAEGASCCDFHFIHGKYYKM